VEALHVNVDDNRIELIIVDRDFLKDVLGSAGGGTSIRSRLAQLKNIAKELKDEGLTVTLSYQGDRLVTVGSAAKPKLSRLVTRTDAVEINNLRRLMELGI
jgi:hypothetical protein